MPFVTARYMNGSEPVSFALRNRSNRFQAALQILREIVRMLEPDGNPQEPVTDPHLRPRFRREALMRRRRRVCDQRFRVPEIVRDADQPERVREAERRRLAAVELEREHGAAAFHLLSRELILRMILAEWVERFLHGFLSRQKIREFCRVR